MDAAFQGRVVELMREGAGFGSAVCRARWEFFGIDTELVPDRETRIKRTLGQSFRPAHAGLSPEARRGAIERRQWRGQQTR